MLFVLKRIMMIPIILLSVAANIFLNIFNIKLIELRGDKLGYMSFQQDILKYLKSKNKIKKNIFIFYNVPPVNLVLKDMWNKKLKENNFLSLLRKFNTKNNLFKFKKIFLNLDIKPNENYQSYIDSTLPPIKFTESQEELGENFLKKMQLKENHFFCFNNRDSTQFKSKNILKYYQNNSSHRNFPVIDLKKSVLYLAKSGISGVFYGFQNEKLNWDEEKIIDYPLLYKSDLLDIFLISKCKFYLGPNSGPMALSTLFRKPTIQINVTPVLGTAGYFSKRDIFIPKKLFSISKNRYLTLREILSNGINSYYTDEKFQNDGIKVVNNSSEEILDATSEMINNLDDNLQDNKKDIEQKEFEKIINSFSETKDYNLPKISSLFVKRNSYFLN